MSFAGGAHGTPVGDVLGDAGPEDRGAVDHGGDTLVSGVEDVDHALAQGARYDEAVIVEEADSFEHPVSQLPIGGRTR